jgi:hypothetical protein
LEKKREKKSNVGMGAGSALMEELLSTLTMELDPTRHVSLLFPKRNRKGR